MPRSASIWSPCVSTISLSRAQSRCFSWIILPPVSWTWKPRGIHLIDYQTPTAVASITLGANPLPLGYDWLEIVWEVRETGAASTDFLNLRFNNDSAANYYRERLTVAGATATGTEVIAATSLEFGDITGASITDAALAGQGRAFILNHAGTTFKKMVTGSGGHFQGLTTGLFTSFALHGLWNNTAAITRIDVLVGTGNFVTGSWVKLLGGVF